MGLKFEISLEHMSIIAFADSLWKKEDILHKTKSYFLLPNEYKKDELWNLITEAVIDKLDPDYFPDYLYDEIVCAVKSLGMRKKDWFEYCKSCNVFRNLCRKDLYEIYCENVIWTYYGTVDEEKIVKSWLRNPKCDARKVYIMACYHCHEEFLKTHKSEPARMFQLAVRKKLKTLAKKSWLALSDQEKRESYDKIPQYNNNSRETNYYKKDQSIEMYLCGFGFLRDMKLKDCNKMFSEVCWDHVTDWPWIKLIIPFAGIMTNTDPCRYSHIFRNIIKINQTRKNKKLYGQILEQLWSSIPEKFKKFTSDVYVEDLFSRWEVGILDRILNDKNLSNIRNDLIKKGYEKFEEFVKEDNLEKISEFIKLLIPSKWEKDIKSSMEKIYQHVMEFELKLADELLISFSLSEVEIDGYKNAINPFVICCYFIIKGKLPFVDEFLLWKFNSKELAESFKLFLYSTEFSARHILWLWDKNQDNIEEAKNKSDDFYYWCSSGCEMLNENINSLIRFLIAKKDCKKLGNFLKWYSGRSMNNFNVTAEIDLPSLMNRNMRGNDWELAQEQLDLIFNNSVKNKNFLNNFLTKDLEKSDLECNCKLYISGTCSLIRIEQSQEAMTKNMKDFIKFWLKPIIKMQKYYDLLKCLREWPKISTEQVRIEQAKYYDSDDNSRGISGLSIGSYPGFGFLYCEENNLKIFLGLIQSFKNNLFENL